jgi:hypothetical protein
VGIRIGLALPALALLAAVPAQAARDSFVRDSPGAAVATCLRPSGAPGVVGLLGPLERRMSPYDVLRVSADGAAVVATARLGILDECPAVAADPSGHTIVAGAVRTRRFGGLIRAALAEPGGGFGAPVDIARTRTSATQVAAAVSPRGDAVVAWASSRFSARRQRLRGRMQVFAALRPAGGTFGRPSPLTPLRRSSFVPEAKVSAAMDASGTATVAWAQPIPDRRDIPSRSTVEVAAAPPGGSFGPPQVLARPVQHTTRVALSVAADGRGLLAHDGQGTIRVYERAARGSAFARVRRLSSRRDDWQRPEVALAPDGSALVSWRGGEAGGSEAVLVSSRRGDGAWTEPAAVQRRQGDDSSVAEFYGIVSQGGRPSPPPDAGNTGLRAAMGADGRYLVSWGVELPLPFGDRRLAARMVRGVAGGAPTRPETSGCPCRSVNGIVPLVTGRGEPLLAYTDNVTSVFAFDIEIPSRFGRLHLAVAGPPGLGPEPPRVTVRPPPPTTLGYANRLRVRVGCDRPCDLRAYVVGGRGRSRGMAVATLRRAGSMRLAIKPKEDRHLAPPSRGRAQVVVHGHAANGRRFVRRSVPVDLRRKPVRPLPRLIDVRAVRRGGGVVVTWRTDRPARRVQFEAVQRLSGRRGVPFTPKYMLGRGRRSFRVRLPGRPDSVAISVRRNRPPFDERTVVVKVSG